MKKNLAVMIFVLIYTAIFVPSPAPAVNTYMVYQQWGGTWHDANKTYSDDSLMCWAASAANILAWGNWTTATYGTETQLFQDFKDHWTNNLGYATYAWRWWLNGTPPSNTYYSYIDVPGGGNYFPTATFTDYYTGKATSNIMPVIDQMMQNDYGVSLVITKGSSSHAITCWGFDYVIVNGVKNYTSVYFTDSDDRVTALRKGAITYNNGTYFTTGHSGWRIGAAYGLEENFSNLAPGNNLAALPPTATPIDSTWRFLASGIMLLAGAGLRRKRYSLFSISLNSPKVKAAR